MNILKQYDPLYDMFFQGYRPRSLNLRRLRHIISAYDIMKGTFRKIFPPCGRSSGMNALVKYVAELAAHTETYGLSEEDDLNFCFASWLGSILGDRAKELRDTDYAYDLMLISKPSAPSILDYLASKNLTNLIYMIIGKEFIDNYSYPYITDIPVILSHKAYLDPNVVVHMYQQS